MYAHVVLRMRIVTAHIRTGKGIMLEGLYDIKSSVTDYN